MPQVLTLKLFGKPHVTLDGKAVSGFISAKAQVLLFYLAVTGRPHLRESLAGLLWGEMPETQATKNLRNALSNLRALVGPYLLITRDEAAFDRASNYSLDVEAFVSALDGGLAKKDLTTLHSAVELYQGDFLEGFNVGDALAMEEWVLARRSLLNGLMVQALHTLVVKHLEREEYAAGIDYANRLLAIEPWREETHRHLMILLARSRQRSAALAQYEICRQVLADELGVEPMPETTALYERIKAAGIAPPHNLPPQPTPIVGREAELAEIASYLNQPGAQLLSLVGPGGIGKTRLAIQAATRCVEPETDVETRFSDGVYFVPLADATADSYQLSLIAALAETLKFDFKAPVHPQAQLLNYLREKDMLLLLDNFDQLVVEARQLGDILRLAPRVKVLVTSRVRLNLQEEWLLKVKGLDYPTSTDVPVEAVADCSAVRLFVRQARHVDAGFTLNDAETPHVIRICQLVGGVPLGIELAASWLRVLSCQEIVSEIEKSSDFLTSPLQDVPERHRSVRAVFDYSWNLLAPTEQDAFRQLSVFRGGFERDAAAKLVGVSLPLLAGLMDKSLLRRNADGRYEIHDLLRHYAEEKLQADPKGYEEIHNTHCRYFAQLMYEHQSQLKGEDLPVALTALDAERENVRAAWNWAMSHRRVEELNLFMECL
jgi:DNA-binding SARP family transcriptional activator/predicted ATPase